VRAHFNRPLQDRMGNQVDVAQIRALVPGTTDLIPDMIYRDDTSGLTLPNPWDISAGEVDFYLGGPRRVRLGITVAGTPETFWEALDVVSPATDSSHPGGGDASTEVGLGAVTGASATGVGVEANASGIGSAAYGRQAVASGEQAVSVGAQAQATEAGATAAGTSSEAAGSQATALGSGAQALYDQSTALGAGAHATGPNQVMLGTGADDVEIASGRVVVRGPGGARFLIAVTDEGLLYTQELGEPAP
jgi:hypothetical protein